MNNYYGFPTYSQRQEVIRVNGRNGADTYQMMPNSSVLLLDEREPLVWLCQTDGAGYKTVTPYRIEEYKETNVMDMLESRISALEEKLNESYTAKFEQKSDEPVRDVQSVQNGSRPSGNDKRFNKI